MHFTQRVGTLQTAAFTTAFSQRIIVAPMRRVTSRATSCADAADAMRSAEEPAPFLKRSLNRRQQLVKVAVVDDQWRRQIDNVTVWQTQRPNKSPVRGKGR